MNLGPPQPEMTSFAMKMRAMTAKGMIRYFSGGRMDCGCMGIGNKIRM